MEKMSRSHTMITMLGVSVLVAASIVASSRSIARAGDVNQEDVDKFMKCRIECSKQCGSDGECLNKCMDDCQKR